MKFQILKCVCIGIVFIILPGCDAFRSDSKSSPSASPSPLIPDDDFEAAEIDTRRWTIQNFDGCGGGCDLETWGGALYWHKSSGITTADPKLIGNFVVQNEFDVSLDLELNNATVDAQVWLIVTFDDSNDTFVSLRLQRNMDNNIYASAIRYEDDVMTATSATNLGPVAPVTARIYRTATDIIIQQDGITRATYSLAGLDNRFSSDGRPTIRFRGDDTGLMDMQVDNFSINSSDFVEQSTSN